MLRSATIEEALGLETSPELPQSPTEETDTRLRPATLDEAIVGREKALPAKRQSGAGGSFDEPRSWLSDALEVIPATGELLGHVGTGMTAMTASGLAGIAGGVVGRAGKWQEETGKFLSKYVYEPKTQLGKESAELLLWPTEKVQGSAKFWGDKALEKWGNPELAASISSGLEIATFFGLPVLGKRLKTNIAKAIKNNKIDGVLRTLEEIANKDIVESAKKGQEPSLSPLIAKRKQEIIDAYRATEHLSLSEKAKLKRKQGIIESYREAKTRPAPEPKPPTPEMIAREEAIKRKQKIMESHREAKQLSSGLIRSLPEQVKQKQKLAGSYREAQATAPTTKEALNVFRKSKGLPEITKEFDIAKQKRLQLNAFRESKGLPEIKKGFDIERQKRLMRKQALDNVDAFRKEKGLRPFREIWDDINTAMGGERGSVSFERLSPNEKAAIERLAGDAKSAGKSVKEFLMEVGFEPSMIPSIERHVAASQSAIPKYAQSVNLEKQTVADSAKRLEMEMAGPRKHQSWDQTDALSYRILESHKKSLKAIQKIKGLKGLTENIDAVRKINVNGIDRLGSLNKELALGKITEAEFQKEFKLYRDDIFRVVSDGSSEIARALNAHKKMVSVTDHMAKGLAKIEGEMTQPQREAFAKAVKHKNNPIAVAKFLKTVENPTLKDYILDYWYNSILSGPPTHAVNILTNTNWLLYQVPHRGHVALWDKLYSGLTGKPRERYVNEIIPMLAGYKTGFRKGAKRAKSMIKEGEVIEEGVSSDLFATKWEQEAGTGSIGAWSRSPHRVMRKAAPFIEPPTKALRAMDVWAKSIAADAEINSIARAKANQKGLRGESRAKFEESYKKSLPEEVQERASAYAKHNVFMDDPDKFTAWLLRVRDVPTIGTASHFIVPFVNTIGNLTKRGMELTPGVGVLKEVAARRMESGLGARTGAAATPELIAKQIEGSILALYILHKCSKGEIIGEAPTTEAQRDALYRQGKKPWSIQFRDTWVQYRRMEPWNTAIASVAIAYDKIVNAKDEKTKTEIFGEVARGLVNNLLDSSYFQGLQQIFNRHEKFKTSPFRLGASFVPYSSFWRSINRSYEKLTEGEVKVREPAGWLPALAQVIPGLSTMVQPELNSWGEEKVIPGSVFQHWLPYKWSKETDNPVEQVLEMLEVYPGLPQQTFTRNNKESRFSDDIYRKLCIDYGHKAKKRVAKLIQKPVWQRVIQSKDAEKYQNLRTAIDSQLTKVRNESRGFAIKEQAKRDSLVQTTIDNNADNERR